MIKAEFMSPHFERKYFVGYQVDRADVSVNSIVGIAQINGEQVEHELSICVQKLEATDVGRSSDGEIVWISTCEESATTAPTLKGKTLEQEFSLLPRSFDPVQHEAKLPSEGNETIRDVNFIAKVAPLAKNKRVLFFLGLVSSLIVTGIVFMPGKQPSTEHIPTHTPSSPSVDENIQDPTQAALDFVRGGSLSQLTIPEGITSEDLHATVVSQSGEVVLVEVSLRTNEELTTFATLLLQKTGATWRIREVFDPQ